MKRLTLFMVLCALVVGLCGCGSHYARGYEYRYRAGTMYEYKQLMDAYSADSDQPPPLPPVSDEPGEGNWVRVPVNPGPVFYDDYYAGRRVVVVDDPYYYYDDWYYPRTHIATSFFYGPRRHYRRSGLSIGFGFGHGRYYGHGGHFGNYGYGYGHGYGLGCWP
jgi:hypothetical protein